LDFPQHALCRIGEPTQASFLGFARAGQKLDDTRTWGRNLGRQRSKAAINEKDVVASVDTEVERRQWIDAGGRILTPVDDDHLVFGPEGALHDNLTPVDVVW